MKISKLLVICLVLSGCDGMIVCDSNGQNCHQTTQDQNVDHSQDQRPAQTALRE